MTDQEFLRRLRRYARKRGLTVNYLPDRGKGSHAFVHLGYLKSVIPRGEISPATFASLLRKLEIDKKEF